MKLPAHYETFTRLVRTQTRLWNAVDAELRERDGVALTAFTALEVIAATPACRVQDLATTLHITVGGASKVSDRLVGAGLVVRTAHPDDRRSSVLQPTRAGAELIRRAMPHLDSAIARRLRLHLTTDDVETLDRLLLALQGPASDEDV